MKIQKLKIKKDKKIKSLCFFFKKKKKKLGIYGVDFLVLLSSDPQSPKTRAGERAREKRKSNG